MAYEYFTIYTEVDEGGDVSKTATRCTSTNLVVLQQTSYVYDDKGANHFSGDFEHLVASIATLIEYFGGTGGLWAIWNLSNDVGDAYYTKEHNGDLDVLYHQPALNDCRIYLREMPGSGSVGYTDYYTAAGNLNNLRYHKIKRDEAAGDYGTLYNYIYSDASRTTLLDTLSVALHAKNDFQNVYCTQTYDQSSVNAFKVSGYVENLDLQETKIKGGFNFAILSHIYH